MALGDDPSDARQAAQDRGLDPIGEALRSTYDAENHDSLGRDLTGLMLELAHVDPAEIHPSADVPATVPRLSLLQRLLGRAPR